MLCLVCLLSLLLGNVLSNSPTLTPQQDEVVYARMGDNVTLGCTMEGADLGTWYYNNVPQEQVTVTMMDGSASVLVQLEIRNVQMAQAGWYTCSFSTGTNRMERDFLLVVGGEPKLETRPLASYTVQRGTRVELPCFVLGVPQPNVTWFDKDGHQIYDGQENGKYRVDATTNSLVIFNVNRTVTDISPFSCTASNSFSNKTYSSSFDFTSDNTPGFQSPDFHSDFHPSSDTVLAFSTRDQPITLTCSSNSSLSYKWFKNGERIEMQNSNTFTIPVNESGFYCCEIIGSGIINTHCVTVFFRFNPRFRPPTIPTSASLPAGRVAHLICRATASSDSSTNYDPPPVVWTSSANASQNIKTNFTDEHGLTYISVEMQEGTSGTYSCAGGNFVKSISQDTLLRSVDLGGSGHTYLRNGLAERSNEDEAWFISGNASLTTVRNERVFMVSATTAGSQLKQTLTLPRGVERVYVRGRMRQSAALDQGSSYPIIQLSFGGEQSILRIPFTASDAWQWVGQSFPTNGSTSLLIILTIMTTDASGVTQREAVDGVAFFDDISVSFPGACSDDEFVCPNGDCAASENDCDDDSSDNLLVIIVGGAGGGFILFLVVVIVIILCCCCYCCRKKKSDARPMRKISTFLKKTRYRRAVPAVPVSFSKTGTQDLPSPASDAAYATLKGDYQEAEAVRIQDAQSPVSDPLYTSLRADIGAAVTDEDYYINTEFPTQTQKKEQRENGGGNLYTSLDPNSFNEQTYYTSTSPSLPHRKKEELAASSLGGVANEDVGGVNLYLEVLPSAPSQSSREASPNPITSPTSISNQSDKAGSEGETEHFDPTTGEIYEYVNTDLGPN